MGQIMRHFSIDLAFRIALALALAARSAIALLYRDIAPSQTAYMPQIHNSFPLIAFFMFVIRRRKVLIEGVDHRRAAV